ncbi:MAG: histidine kinase [Pseudomonadota bacterium]
MKAKTIALVAVLWMVVGGVHALSRYSDIVRYQLAVAFTLSDVSYYLMSYVSWSVITLVLLHLMRHPRFAFAVPPMAGVFFIGLLLWLPLYLSYDYGISTLLAGGNWANWLERLVATSGSVIYFYTVVYALTFALCGGIVLADRARDAHQTNLELERQRTQTALEMAEQQMQLMQSQLSPHFLFNCLGSMSFLARRAQKSTLVDAIATLGNLLRYTVENASQRQVSLGDELRFVQDYLDLQSLRFGDRFNCRFDTSTGLENAICLPFTLQPLVENVFRHVVEQLPQDNESDAAQGVDIHVDVRLEDSRVQLRVCNSRAPRNDVSATPPSHGTGLRNLETRLQHTYGERYDMSTQVTDELYCVRLSFPTAVPSSA